MMQEKLKEIRDLLTEVKYPGTSKNIVELDMVQNIRIEGEKVLFRLVFQKASDPFVGSLWLLKDIKWVWWMRIFSVLLFRKCSVAKRLSPIWSRSTERISLCR